MIKIISSIFLLIPFFKTSAQNEKIITDRPGQTSGPYTVQKKWMQFEMGFLKETTKYDRNLNKDFYFQHPALLTKYGLSKRIELRLTATAYTEKYTVNTGAAHSSSFEALQIGGKVNFIDEKGLRPKTSIIAHYVINNLQGRFYKDSINGANFRFTMQHTLSQKISLAYNIGMEWGRFDYPPAYVYTFTPGINLSDNWYAYIEIFGFIWKNETPENSIDAGLAYYINDNFKIDATAGLGINKKAPDNYFALGASFGFKTGKN